MNDNSLNIKLKVLAIWALIILICYTLLNICSYFMSLVTMLGFSIVITYILLEPVNFLEKYLPHIPNCIKNGEKEIDISRFTAIFNRRVVSIFVIYISFIVMVIFLAVKLIPPTAQQVVELASSVPKYATISEQKFDNLINYFNRKFPQLNIKSLSTNTSNNALNNPVNRSNLNYSTQNNFNSAGLLDNNLPNNQTGYADSKNNISISSEQLTNIKNNLFQKLSLEIITIVQNNASYAINNILNAATSSLTAIGYIITVIVLSFYFLLDGSTLVTKINSLIPEKNVSKVMELEESIHNSLLGFLKGQVLLGILTGLFMWPVYSFFGVNYAIFLCIFLAVAEILPVIGSSIGFIPAIIVILFTNPMNLIPVWIIFFLFQNVKDNIIAPRIVGSIIGLHPVTVMLSLWIGYKVAGFFGILFAIPAASIINVIISFILDKKTTIPRVIE